MYPLLFYKLIYTTTKFKILINTKIEIKYVNLLIKLSDSGTYNSNSFKQRLFLVNRNL